MTLIVFPYYIDEHGKQIDLVVPENSGANDMAGLEHTRKTFYGSEISKKLGLSRLPMLAKMSIVRTEYQDLDKLKSEVNLLLDNLDLFKESFDQNYWVFRLNNIHAAIDVAKSFGDPAGVEIS